VLWRYFRQLRSELYLTQAVHDFQTEKVTA
jgi:hypothetical protein